MPVRDNLALAQTRLLILLVFSVIGDRERCLQAGMVSLLLAVTMGLSDETLHRTITSPVCRGILLVLSF